MNVRPKMVVVPICSPPAVVGALKESTRRAGSLLSLASRYGAALKICRPLIKSTSIASAQSQCVVRATIEWR